MKKLVLLIFLIIGIQYSSKAQVDIQINPIAILFETIQLSVEFPIQQSGGIEVDVVGGGGEFGVIGIGKYYMRPEYGADRFYIGAFAGALSDSGGGLGFISGYKWLSSSGVSFELALGIGRGFGDLEVFPYGKLSVGYRFGKK